MVKVKAHLTDDTMHFLQEERLVSFITFDAELNNDNVTCIF
ncbi:PNPOx family protein [Evansella halocellulosilytica]|nr:hypothetical protein [Evansella halocellulosilytica]